jgi:hypothetical protein
MDPRQDLDEGGLACAVLSDERMYFPRPQFEGTIFDRLDSRECLA